MLFRSVCVVVLADCSNVVFSTANTYDVAGLEATSAKIIPVVIRLFVNIFFFIILLTFLPLFPLVVHDYIICNSVYILASYFNFFNLIYNREVHILKKVLLFRQDLAFTAKSVRKRSASR